jgi:hypothetical protein
MPYQPDKTELITSLLSKGILQMGHFIETGGIKPYKWHFEMLPAYPSLMNMFYRHLLPYCDPLKNQADARLVTTSKTTSLGVLIANELQLPLVYSAGCGENPVYDFIGAYDVGHIAYFIVEEVNENTDDLLMQANRVGLEIEKILTLVGYNDHYSQNVKIETVLQWQDILNYLREFKLATKKQIDIIYEMRVF